ncbi:MAG: septum formation inhibitor Maf [Oscillatoria sp. SIO1A7]|nr:septum formation inhibitor Maf [Oscillatoria sp. SIO1A7]
MSKPTFVLGSKSPARRLLLQNAGIKAAVMGSNFDESQVRESNPAKLVQVLAQCKAEAVAEKLRLPESAGFGFGSIELIESLAENRRDCPILVLGCDSVLGLDGEIYGKPADATEAIARWERMRGNVGELYTGHALLDLTEGKALVRCQTTRVYFANVSDRQIEAYVCSGEPLNCAGCFAIDGRGGLFVEKIEGCHTNVIGLSLPLLRQMMADLGYDVTDFW